MNANSFRYADAQWRRLGEIVERAGGAVVRDKLNAQRVAFEKMVGGWKGRIERWDGRTFGHDDSAAYERIEQAARELGAAFARAEFPGNFHRLRSNVETLCQVAGERRTLSPVSRRRRARRREGGGDGGAQAETNSSRG